MPLHSFQPLSAPAGRQAVLTAAQHAQLDGLAPQFGVSLQDLVWSAAQQVAAQIQQRWPEGQVLVLCGKGLNGADGLLCAEILRRQGRQVQVCCFFPLTDLSADAAWARQLWLGPIVPFNPSDLPQYAVVVDALLGAGFKGQVPAAMLAWFAAVNASDCQVCAIDLPSGLQADTAQFPCGALAADMTVTFECFKPAHVLMPGRDLCGQLVLADIGMPQQAHQSLATDTALNGPQAWSDCIPRPGLASHKYHRGHVLVVGGEVLTGASRLSARAAQRAGAGLVSLQVPESVWPVYAAAMESIMVGKLQTPALLDSRMSVVVYGPGAGLGAATRERVQQLLLSDKALVLDADALSSFASDPARLWASMRADCVLTPHTGEFARLFPEAVGSKLEQAREAAQKSGAVIVLKGADTVIAHPDGRCLINTCAPPYLATGGSGDVLAGLIAGLVAQGMGTFEAAAAGVWLHAQAALALGPGLIPEDLLSTLPAVLAELYAV